MPYRKGDTVLSTQQGDGKTVTKGGQGSTHLATCLSSAQEPFLSRSCKGNQTSWSTKVTHGNPTPLAWDWFSLDYVMQFREESQDRKPLTVSREGFLTQKPCHGKTQSISLLDVVTAGHESQCLYGYFAALSGAKWSTKPREQAWQDRRQKELWFLLMAMRC